MAAVSLKTLRTIAIYTGLSLGVTVGGVAMGALVVAPAVSRAKPMLQRVMTPAPQAEPASSRSIAALKADAFRAADRTLQFVSALPKAQSAAIVLAAVILAGGLLVYRRRRPSALVGATPAVRMPIITAAKPASTRSAGTPKAVVALAESGASMADIARRTRMPLDAVAMCLSMGSMGARQLRPPTA